MEVMLFYLNVVLVVFLCNEVRKSERSELSGKKLGLFSYRDEAKDGSQ